MPSTAPISSITNYYRLRVSYTYTVHSFIISFRTVELTGSSYLFFFLLKNKVAIWIGVAKQKSPWSFSLKDWNALSLMRKKPALLLFTCLNIIRISCQNTLAFELLFTIWFIRVLPFGCRTSYCSVLTILAFSFERFSLWISDKW